MLTDSEEWELELELFNAFNNKDLPEYYRELLAKLWKAYCELSFTRDSI